MAELIKLGRSAAKQVSCAKTPHTHTRPRTCLQSVRLTAVFGAFVTGTFEPIDDAFKITMTGGLRECSPAAATAAIAAATGAYLCGVALTAQPCSGGGSGSGSSRRLKTGTACSFILAVCVCYLLKTGLPCCMTLSCLTGGPAASAPALLPSMINLQQATDARLAALQQQLTARSAQVGWCGCWLCC